MTTFTTINGRLPVAAPRACINCIHLRPSRSAHYEARTHPVNPPPVCLQLEACFAGTCDEPVLLAGGGSRPQTGFCLTENAGRVSHSNFDPRLAPTGRLLYFGPIDSSARNI
jgi:hypothetical protein